MNEQRTNPDFCPTHGKAFRCREDDKLVCLIHDCDWTAPARRKTDEQIPTIGIIKAKWS